MFELFVYIKYLKMMPLATKSKPPTNLLIEMHQYTSTLQSHTKKKGQKETRRELANWGKSYQQDNS